LEEVHKVANVARKFLQYFDATSRRAGQVQIEEYYDSVVAYGGRIQANQVDLQTSTCPTFIQLCRSVVLILKFVCTVGPCQYTDVYLIAALEKNVSCVQNIVTLAYRCHSYFSAIYSSPVVPGS